MLTRSLASLALLATAVLAQARSATSSAMGVISTPTSATDESTECEAECGPILGAMVDCYNSENTEEAMTKCACTKDLNWNVCANCLGSDAPDQVKELRQQCSAYTSSSSMSGSSSASSISSAISSSASGAVSSIKSAASTAAGAAAGTSTQHTTSTNGTATATGTAPSATESKGNTAGSLDARSGAVALVGAAAVAALAL